LLSAWLALTSAAQAPFYAWFTALQVGVYVAAPAAYILCKRFNLGTGLLSVPFYFILANAAALWGFIVYLRGARAVTWTTVR
jgi:hypothetical protein